MANLDKVASIDDLRSLARRRLPRFAFDFIDGGAEEERCLKENRGAFQAIEIMPRYLVDVSSPKTEVTLWNITYSAPIGIAPMGFLNMAWPGADTMAAKLAAEVRIPHVIGAASSTPLEELANNADGMAWFQIYVATDSSLTNKLLKRARVAGCDVLVVTVDVTQAGKRDRDIRNGLQMPFRLSPKIALDLALHPKWSLLTMKAGAPGFANFSAVAGQSVGSITLPEIQRSLISNTLDWDDLRKMRDNWKGRMVVKGLMHPDDAKRAAELGCDAVQVSNHGGRQADFAPASINSLHAVRSAVGPSTKVFIDSGIRRGTDIVRGKALGSDFTFAGRPFAYGAAACGAAGMRKAFDLLKLELSRALGQMGCPTIEKVDANVLARPADS